MLAIGAQWLVAGDCSQTWRVLGDHCGSGFDVEGMPNRNAMLICPAHFYQIVNLLNAIQHTARVTSQHPI